MQKRKIIIRSVCFILASYLCINLNEANSKEPSANNKHLEMDAKRDKETACYPIPIEEIKLVQLSNEIWDKMRKEWGLNWNNETTIDKNDYWKLRNGAILSSDKWNAMWKKWDRIYGDIVPIDESISNYRTHYRGPLCFRFNEEQNDTIWKRKKFAKEEDFIQNDGESYHIPMLNMPISSRMNPHSLVIGKTREQIKDTVEPLYVIPSEPSNIYVYNGVRYYGFETVRPYIDPQGAKNIHILKAITGAKCNSIYCELEMKIAIGVITLPKFLPSYKSPW